MYERIWRRRGSIRDMGGSRIGGLARGGCKETVAEGDRQTDEEQDCKYSVNEDGSGGAGRGGVAVGEDEVVHDDVDECSIEQARAYGVLVEKWHSASGEYEARRPDQCDEEMQGEAEEGGVYTSREGGAAEQAAGDGLGDANGGSAVAEVVEDDGVENVEYCGGAASEEDRFEERG